MKQTTEHPIEDLIAADGFLKTILPRVDDAQNIMWHGWVISDAFVVGIQWPELPMPEAQ